MSNATSIIFLGEPSIPISSLALSNLPADISMLSLTALFLELNPSSRVDRRLTDSSLVKPGSFEVDGIPKLWKKDRG
jgi:hypothetical protein